MKLEKEVNKEKKELLNELANTLTKRYSKYVGKRNVFCQK